MRAIECDSGASEEVVIDVLARPGRVTEGLYGKIHAWRQAPLGWIRVTYVVESEGSVIVTVTKRRRGAQEP
jgi:hypothetical protein